MTSRLIAVIGMHRSGTSAVARLTNLLGVDLGPEAALLPAQVANPAGFWENMSVLELHEELLDALGGTWFRPPVLDEGWQRLPDLEPFRRRTAELIERLYGNSAVAGWKDPRGSLLLPLWTEVATFDGVVVCLRHPAEVAASLQKRDGFETEHSAHLWLRYTVASVRVHERRLLVRYDELFDDLQGVAERIAAFLDVDPPDGDTMDGARKAIETDLRHHHAVAVPNGSEMSIAAALYDSLVAGAGLEVETLMDALQEHWLIQAGLEMERGHLTETVGRQAAQLERLKDHNASQQETLDRVEELSLALQQEVDALRTSTSWRVTAPMRAIGNRLPWLRRLLRRGD